MKVFLSYALSPYDGALSARLRAVALVYNIDLLLPTALNRQNLPRENKKKIESCDAVIVLISDNIQRYQPAEFFKPLTYADELQAVNLELGEAMRLLRPVIALVESPNLIHGLPTNQIIVFDRQDPTKHENLLFQALGKIKSQKNKDDLIKALGALGLVALGFLALNEFTKESNGD